MKCDKTFSDKGNLTKHLQCDKYMECSKVYGHQKV